MYEYRAVANKIIGRGGLRVNLSIDLGFGIGHVQSLPLFGVVINEDIKRQAVRWLAELLPERTPVVATIHKVGSEYAATIYIEGQSYTVNDMIVEEGFATSCQPTSVTK